MLLLAVTLGYANKMRSRPKNKGLLRAATLVRISCSYACESINGCCYACKSHGLFHLQNSVRVVHIKTGWWFINIGVHNKEA